MVSTICDTHTTSLKVYVNALTVCTCIYQNSLKKKFLDKLDTVYIWNKTALNLKKNNIFSTNYAFSFLTGYASLSKTNFIYF